MKKQGRAARMDESLGMRNGPARSKKQSYKDRRDESKGMQKKKEVSRHAPESNFMGQSSKVMAIDPMGEKGYPPQAFHYDY